MVLEEALVQIEDDDVLPSTDGDENVVRCCFDRGNILEVVVDWAKVDYQPDIVFGEKMVGF